MAFLYGSDRGRYNDLLIDLQNSFTQGIDKYPTTLDEAYLRLASYVPRARPPISNTN
jgi:hypothetical protein